MRQVFHLVNGILNFPGSSKNWNGRGVTWLHTRTDARAEKIEYFCGPIDRAFGQKKRALKLFQTMQHYDESGWQNIVVGHSNGAAVAIAMMRDYFLWPDIEHLHLVCAACEADFDRNGLNDCLRIERVKLVSVYIGGRDWALRLAHSLPARILGYGVLGLHGPRNVRADVKDRVKVVRGSPWTGYGHSSCWEDPVFNQTMATFSGT